MATHQVGLKVRREGLHGILNRNNSLDDDQLGDPLHDLNGLECLHGFLIWVLDPSIAT